MRTAIPCLLAVALGIPLPARADGPRPEVLVLGTYHMANPGRDIFNMQADDVLAPKRQQEIAELLAVLEKFNPTKIAIERDEQKKVDEVYGKYLAGEYTLTANEIDQIGFRLAKELHHPTVYAVDADGDFPFLRLVHYAKGTDQSAKLDKIMADIGEMVKAQDAYLKSHTVLETLLYMNADAKVAEDVGYYYQEARIGEPWDYAGPDLLAEWYRRNVRIFNNVARIATSPDDRILVIFGAGHLGWLRQAFGGDPMLRLRKLQEFAPERRQ
jgi:hypothetical protein